MEPPELVAPEGAGLVVDAAPVQAASNVGTDDATSAAPAPRLRNARRLNGGLGAAGVTVDASYSVGDTPPGGLLRWRAPASWGVAARSVNPVKRSVHREASGRLVT